MSVARNVERVIVLVRCAMAVIPVWEKFFMHRKGKLVRFMTVLEIISVCKIVVNDIVNNTLHFFLKDV